MTVTEIDAQIEKILAAMGKPQSLKFSTADGAQEVTHRNQEELERSLAFLRQERARVAGTGSSFTLAVFRKSG